MKYSAVHPRKFTSFCFSILMTLISLSASSLEIEEAKTIFKSIHEIRVNSYLAINSYYNFSGNADKEALNEVREAMTTIASLMNDLTNHTDVPAIRKNIAETQRVWHKYKELIETNINDVLGQGYSELQVVSEMADRNVEMDKHLGRMYSAVKEESEFKPNIVIEQTRNASLLMAMMVTKYSARSTSNISQIFQGSEADKAIDTLAYEFDKNLNALVNFANDDKTADLLKKTLVKWNFIRKSYFNYNENNVNFVLNRYSMRIISSLEETASLYENT